MTNWRRLDFSRDRSAWLGWMVLCTAFLLYCAFFWPEPGGPSFGSIAIWSLGLSLLFLGAWQIGTSTLLVTGLVLYFFSEALESGKVIAAGRNPLIPGYIGLMLGIASIIFVAAAVLVGIWKRFGG